MLLEHLFSDPLFSTPRLLGYVYEESFDRVVGFVYTAIRGRRALVADYDWVLNALKGLHGKGSHYGGINKHSILITTEPKNEVVIIDFEDSTLTAASGLPDADIAEMMQAEEQKLHAALTDESGSGAPWAHIKL